ncbi:MAG: hypothetical protein JWM11_7951 [Planctomycetaceae bacterium]|nr:hypothetical protein [Planctomycetaceae bacterium]
MKRILCMVAFFMTSTVVIQAEDLPADVVEILKTLEQESDQIRAKMELEIVAKRQIAIGKLKVIQDSHTREGKLDEAMAVRDSIRELKDVGAKPMPHQPPPALQPILNGNQLRMAILVQPNSGLPANPHSQNSGLSAVDSVDLPPQAAQLNKALEQESNEIRTKMETEIAAKRMVVIRKLQGIQENYSREAKLDEALAVRDLIRSLKSAGLKALPDPGTLIHYRGQEAKVLLFDVVGAIDSSVYGTDVYTDDSDLSTAAVHANVLRPGQRGIVKVTILPGQDAYLGTNKNGVNSSSYVQYPGSYKVQSLFRGNRPAGGEAPPAGPDATALPVVPTDSFLEDPAPERR